MPWPSSAVNSGPRRLSQAHGITETRRNSQPTCSAASCSSPADRPDVQSQAQVAEAEHSAGEEAPRTAGAAVDGVTAAGASERMTDQGAKVVGFTGPEPEELARRSSENLEAVTQASTVLARGAQEVSQELL